MDDFGVVDEAQLCQGEHAILSKASWKEKAKVCRVLGWVSRAVEEAARSRRVSRADLTAVQTNEGGHPLSLKLSVLEGFVLTDIAAWVQQNFTPGTEVLPDKLSCFHGIAQADCAHEPVVVGSGKAAVERPEFRWVNTSRGNIKNALRGTYHAIRPKFAQRHLSEFEYRFSCRFDLSDIIPKLVHVALRMSPMPQRPLELRIA